MALARQAGERPAQSREIAERQQIPAPYLDQILLQLRRGGIVRSVRGVAGGFLLARPAEEITVGEVLRALRGDISVFKLPEDAAARRAGACALVELWERLQHTVSDVVDGATLRDLAQRQEALEQARTPMFYI